ncbi:MAG: ADP-ribosylglycohydrolase family protein, partial [Candidatus Spechtbacteria bacterium]|nr:ADP-ribosylglycohydrolase family protein [Candidatus Spechtbacteria bacterium]
LKQVAEATEEMLLAGGEERISKQISRIMSLIRFENLEDEDGVQEGGDSLEKKSMLCRASIEEINSWFGGGGSYAYHSFGFSYALFARCALKRQLGEHVHPFEPVFWAVNGGGDTDSNAAIIGALAGALHGTKAIPLHIISRIEGKAESTALTEQFFKAVKNLAAREDA